MAFSEQELHQCKASVAAFLEKRRPPERVRDQVDVDYRIERQSIVIFERRRIGGPEADWIESPVAKVTYVRIQDVWKIYWQMSDMEWHGYEPHAEAETLGEALVVVDQDQHGCFWG